MTLVLPDDDLPYWAQEATAHSAIAQGPSFMRILQRHPAVSKDERPFVQVALPGKPEKPASKAASRYLELADIALGIRCNSKHRRRASARNLIN